MTPQMNEKAMWVYFLAYNLIRLLMCEAALQVEILPPADQLQAYTAGLGSLEPPPLGNCGIRTNRHAVCVDSRTVRGKPFRQNRAKSLEEKAKTLPKIDETEGAEHVMKSVCTATRKSLSKCYLYQT